MATGFQVTFDCADPDRLARFWAAALGYILQPPPEGYGSWDTFLAAIGVPPSERHTRSALIDPDGVGPRLFFQQVPEPKTAKNRVHLDVNAGGGPGTPPAERQRRVEATASELAALGATEVSRVEEAEYGEYWIVMADPEGNEFCLQ